MRPRRRELTRTFNLCGPQRLKTAPTKCETEHDSLNPQEEKPRGLPTSVDSPLAETLPSDQLQPDVLPQPSHT
jgi:hypothetical protein